MKFLTVSNVPLHGAFYGRTGRLLALLNSSYLSSVYDLATFELTEACPSDGARAKAMYLAYYPHGGPLLESMGYWPADEEVPRPPEDGPPLPRLPQGVNETWIAFHPDGRHTYVYRYPGQVTLRDLEGVVRTTLAHDLPGPLFERLDTAADGSLCVGILAHADALVFDLPSGEKVRTLHHTTHVRRTRFAPAGPLVATAAGRTVYLWEAATGELAWRSRAFRADVLSLAFSPDGRLLFAGAREGRVRVWDVASGRERADLDWKAGAVHAVAVAPDGATAVAACGSGQAVVWDLDF